MKKGINLLGLTILIFLTACVSSGKPVEGLVSLDEAMNGAVAEIGSQVDGKTEIAIAGIDTSLVSVGGFLTDELGTHLASSRQFTLLERGNALGAVDAEHQFQMSGMVDDASAVGIGHYLGAKIILTGTFSNFADFSQIRLRAIDVLSGRLLTLYSARIQPNDRVLANVMRPEDKANAPAITEDALAHLNRGKDFGAEGKFDEAIQEFDQALAINKDLVEVYVRRGSTYSVKGDNDKAIADCNQAIQLNPNYPEAYFWRGVAYGSKHEFDKGIADYNQAINLSPYYASAYGGRGFMYAFKGDYDKAIADATRAIQLNPLDAGAYSLRGGMYANKGEKDQAIADWELSLSIKFDPNVAGYLEKALVERGMAYNNNKDFDRAFADFTTVLSINPNNSLAYVFRGFIYNDRGDLDHAIADWEAYLRINPDDEKMKNTINHFKQQGGR
jgi:tetratricopeptide (TPR) repeat protein